MWLLGISCIHTSNTSFKTSCISEQQCTDGPTGREKLYIEIQSISRFYQASGDISFKNNTGNPHHMLHAIQCTDHPRLRFSKSCWNNLKVIYILERFTNSCKTQQLKENKLFASNLTAHEPVVRSSFRALQHCIQGHISGNRTLLRYVGHTKIGMLYTYTTCRLRSVSLPEIRYSYNVLKLYPVCEIKAKLSVD
jgi:hypothetical protein